VLLPRGSSFAVTTSDEFFSTLRPSKRYDVAFIDGLHTFEQTYRDVINTFAHLRSGVILIDDTVPSDEYSAIPDQEASYRARDAAGLEGRPWHGDVWRVVMLLIAITPSWSGARSSTREIHKRSCGDEVVVRK